MKVIDLLNKIANGEEVPKKFNFAQQTFTRKGSYIEDEDGDSIFESMCTDFSNINEEVEIIEEENEIEKLDYKVEQLENPSHNESLLMNMVRENKEAINKLIDAVNELKENK